MNTHIFIGTFWSLLPPLVAILSIIITKRVRLSLSAGVLVGALMIADFHLLPALNNIFNIFVDLFWNDALNTWTINIILFILLLGLLAALISISGGKKAFSTWALQHINTQRSAGLFTVLLGFVIFIDAFFSSLTLGNISRPITDKQHISRAKLAYFLDSTSAPVCSIAPLSSWSAYIMSIFGTLFITLNITAYSPMTAFLYLIPFNFYAIFALLMVIIMAATKWDVGPMRTHQENAAHGQLFDASKGNLLGAIDALPESQNGHMRDLVLPLFALVVATFVGFIGFGYYALPSEITNFSLFTLLEHADVSAVLVFGGLAGVLTSVLLLLPKKLPWSQYKNAGIAGSKTMPAISLLICVWILIQIIEGLQPGVYLVDVLTRTSSFAFLPFSFFMVAVITSFIAGTSWGTFGILFPLVAEIAVASGNTALLIPAFGAVLAGSVFGDHCSPFSTNTILSASGAGSPLMDHVITQLPYALFCAFCAGVGYFMLAYLPAWQAFACAAGVFIIGILWMRAAALR